MAGMTRKDSAMAQSRPVEGGVLAAVLTPLNADLSPDLDSFVAHCRHLLASGCDGLAVLGTTSEANSFSVEERIALLESLAKAGIAGARLIPGTGCCAIPDTVRLSKRAVELGAAGVLMLPPFYYKPVTDEGLFAAYAEVIERVGHARLKVYLYHIPQNTGVPITRGLVERLLKAYPGTVVGMKDSAGDFANMKAMCESFPGFRVFSGSDSFLLDVLRAGGAGCITACNNIASQRAARVYAGWRGAGADALQAEYAAIRKAVQQFPLIEALKEAMARLTGQPGWRRLRPPLMPLSAADGQRLADALARVGLALEPA
jgi:4-hydroxy-tetrahydrodipicolinate synthase